MSEPERYPLISVVIPTYNRGEILAKAIASVREQSYNNWEIIVVDDASKDDTKEIVKNIGDRRIHYVRHETNLGGSEARNTGIDRASGEYIAFLDSDDRWLPEKLTQQLAAIAAANAEQDIVSYTQFNTSFQVAYRREIYPPRGKQEKEKVADYLWVAGGEMLTSTLIVSRELAVKTRFKPQLKKHQDIDFILRLETANPYFIFVPQPLTIWHNEPRHDRVSKILDDRFSLDWIEQYRNCVSDKAYYGFIVKEIIPKLLLGDERKQYAAISLWLALTAGAISFSYFCLLMTRVIVPRRYQEILKTAVQEIGKKKS